MTREPPQGTENGFNAWYAMESQPKLANAVISWENLGKDLFSFSPQRHADHSFTFSVRDSTDPCDRGNVPSWLTV